MPKRWNEDNPEPSRILMGKTEALQKHVRDDTQWGRITNFCWAMLECDRMNNLRAPGQRRLRVIENGPACMISGAPEQEIERWGWGIVQ